MNRTDIVDIKHSTVVYIYNQCVLSWLEYLFWAAFSHGKEYAIIEPESLTFDQEKTIIIKKIIRYYPSNYANKFLKLLPIDLYKNC